MTENENKEEVKAEVQQPATAPNIAQGTEEPQKPQEESPEQINWRRFREERAKERKQKEESDRIAQEERQKAAAFKAALEAITNKPANSPSRTYSREDNPSDYPPLEPEESEDQRIEKKIAKILQDKEAEFERKRIQEEREKLPQMLSQAHKDFNNICTQENIDYLEYHYPEVAGAFKYMPDNFEKWSSIYQAVKRFVPNTDGRKEAAKAEKNLTKPQSASKAGFFVGHGTIQGNGRVSEEQKAANWERMQREMRRI